MDTIQRLNQTIDYIEEHLDQEINTRELAKLNCCSDYHFQRMFSFIADVSLAEYIRKRRLTAAAFDLQHTEIKIIDLAVKYGYQSADSFTKAFYQIHQVTPSKAREKGVELKSFPPISFQLSIKGAIAMKYRIEERSAFKVVGIKEQISTIDGENAKEIPKIWERVNQDGTAERIEELANTTPDGILGVCANFTPVTMDYWVAAATTLAAPTDFETLEIGSQMWAIFEVVGPMPEAIQDAWQRIFSEWFPKSGYEHADGPEFEWYSLEDPAREDYLSEIWIPVVKIN
ncbi:GyrI-like domain-containing protein [Carnobacterium gallinarum]|uniref:AraC family transcriptional regulator n=1 Tax=Carnobacterium gallinarum TaxID=2749 RepID=UPI0005508AB0|nr:AraC family transcriptional regulator [Carnobacterium gallinarum]